MIKLRKGLIVIAILLIVAQVVLLDFDNLSWKEYNTPKNSDHWLS